MHPTRTCYLELVAGSIRLHTGSMMGPLLISLIVTVKTQQSIQTTSCNYIDFTQITTGAAVCVDNSTQFRCFVYWKRMRLCHVTHGVRKRTCSALKHGIVISTHAGLRVE